MPKQQSQKCFEGFEFTRAVGRNGPWCFQDQARLERLSTVGTELKASAQGSPTAFACAFKTVPSPALNAHFKPLSFIITVLFFFCSSHDLHPLSMSRSAATNGLSPSIAVTAGGSNKVGIFFRNFQEQCPSWCFLHQRPVSPQRAPPQPAISAQSRVSRNPGFATVGLHSQLTAGASTSQPQSVRDHVFSTLCIF
jgi:hypothetical protein